MPFAYILYSSSCDRFYIGSTNSTIIERIEKHNLGYYPGPHFTKQAKDWELFLSIECASPEQSKSIEKHIKSMKSRKYLFNLKAFPELIEKLLADSRSPEL